MKSEAGSLKSEAGSLKFLTAAAALLAVACTGSAERPLLERFFSAARLRDRTALADVATTAFEPRERGTVLGFDVTAVQAAAADRKDVTVSARLRLPSGGTIVRTLVVSEQQIGGEWMVTTVRDGAAAASPGSPALPRS